MYTSGIYLQGFEIEAGMAGFICIINGQFCRPDSTKKLACLCSFYDNVWKKGLHGNDQSRQQGLGFETLNLFSLYKKYKKVYHI